MGMALLYSPLMALLLLLLLIHQSLQSVVEGDAHLCSDGPSPCRTFVLYRARGPDYLRLDSISDLFGVSKLMIAQASNLENEDTVLVEGQRLFVPVICGCMGNVSQANITYQIRGIDNYYAVATTKFENLTTYQAAEAANPELDPYDLPEGIEVVIPIRCGCPSKAQMEKGINMLLTYGMQADDTLLDISRKFNANLQELISGNGARGSAKFGGSTILIPVSKKPVLSQPIDPFSSPPFPSYPVMPNSNALKGSNYSSKGVSIGVPISGAVGFLAVGIVFGILKNRQRSSKLAKVCEGQKQPPCPKLGGTEINSVVAKEELLAGVSDCLEKPSVYSIEDLREATQNFSPLSNIGGSVYRGIINGRESAIKQMRGDVSEELKILRKVNHGNLVRLEGFCISREGQSYLIYEYAENGSLDLWLRNRPGAPNSFLTWKTRLQIALDVASGLQYIHEHTVPSVVHKDVKSSNILLNGKLRAKIANFAMAKCGINALTKHIKGTQGYMAPEYLAHGLVTPKVDVFAFGVVLLELISGKEAVNNTARYGLLWTQIRPLLEGDTREEKLRKWMDPNLQNLYAIDSALSLAIMAKACVSEDPAVRPTMADNVYRLSKLLDVCFDHEIADSWEMDRSKAIPIAMSGR